MKVTETSKAAFKSIDAESFRLLILDFIKSRTEGATCDEIEESLGIKHQTASARLCELQRKNMIRIEGTRLTRSNRKANVYFLKD